MFRVRLVMMSVLAVFAVSAVAAASASAETLHWYHAGGTLITLGEELLIMGLGETQTLKGEAGGVGITITCPHLDIHGWILNPANKGAGHTLQLLLYLGCTVAPSALLCEIPEKMIHTSVIGTLGGTSAAPTMLLTPDGGGSTFVNIEFVNCKQAGLNGLHPASGDALAKLNNANSTVEVNEAKATSMLSFAENKAEYKSGAVEILMEGGGLIEARE